MATDRRRDAATAATGMALVGAGGAVRERGIKQAHRLMGRDPEVQRVFIPARSLFKAPKSKARGRARGVYAAGTAVGMAGIPAAARGSYNLINPRKRVESLEKREKRSLVAEGVSGTGEAIRDQAKNTRNQPNSTRGIPIAAALAGSAGGSQLAHMAFNRMPKKLGRARHAVTAMSGVGGALATLPVSNAAMRRQAPEYEVTPNGVRRKKTAPSRPSGKAHVVETRAGRDGAVTGIQRRMELVPNDHRFGKSTISKLNAKQLKRLQNIALGGSNPEVRERATSLWARALNTRALNKDVLPLTARGKGTHMYGDKLPYGRYYNHHRDIHRTNHYLARQDAGELASMPRDRRVSRRQWKSQFGKADLAENYAGRDMNPKAKRAALYAAGSLPVPVLNDVAAAGAAARMAPPEQRGDAFRRQLGAQWGGSAAGAAAGAYGATKLGPKSVEAAESALKAKEAAGAWVKRRPTARRVAASRPAQAYGRVKRSVTSAGSGRMAGPKAAVAGTKAWKKVAAPFADKRKAPLLLGGAALGNMVVGQIAGNAAYSRTLQLERKRNRKLALSKSVSAAPMTQRDRAKMARKKRTQAAVSTFTGLTGLGALGALGAQSAIGRSPKLAARMPKAAERLGRVNTHLLTAGAGVGGAGSLNFAGVMRREADAEQAKVRKGLVPVAPAGLRRAKTYRNSSIRLIQTPIGMRPVRVRAGVG